MPPHTYPEFYTREAEKQRENIYFLSLVFLILKMINNLVVTEIYLNKSYTVSHSVFHGDYCIQS